MKNETTARQTEAGHGNNNLSAILDAKSIAIVGASDDPAKIAGRPLAYMLARGYTGKIHAVNPARQFVQGQASYSSLRSEEHTSELQSLMRISYAVFCLKKNKNRTPK